MIQEIESHKGNWKASSYLLFFIGSHILKIQEIESHKGNWKLLDSNPQPQDYMIQEIESHKGNWKVTYNKPTSSSLADRFKK